MDATATICFNQINGMWCTTTGRLFEGSHQGNEESSFFCEHIQTTRIPYTSFESGKKHPVLQGASCACAIKPPMAPAESFQIPATQLPDVMGLVDMRAKGPDADLSAKSRSIWERTCFTSSLLEIVSSLLLGSRDQQNYTYPYINSYNS